MAEPIENTAGSPQIAEHLEAVISGRLRKALLLTFVILAVMHHNPLHIRLAHLALEGRRRTPLSRRR